MANLSTFIASIDLGTTFSGIAFASSDKNMNIDYITCPVGWPCSRAGNETKVPTVALFDERRIFMSFGFQAKEDFVGLSPNRRINCYYFEHFKMKLHNRKKLHKYELLQATNNHAKELPIIIVFREVLRYLKNTAFERLKVSNTSQFKESDIHWVITVPAIWCAEARQFMRDAAKEAGLLTDTCDPRRLTIALEPEGAAIAMSKHLVPQYSKYMIIDCGGGTIDICMHEKVKGINNNDTIKELSMPSGGEWGGIYVDNEFKRFLEDVYSPSCINQIKKESPKALLDITEKFQLKKVQFKTKCSILIDGTIKDGDEKSFVYMDPTYSFVRAVEEYHKKNIQQILEESNEGMKFRYESFQITHEKMISFFKSVIVKLLHHIKKLLADNSSKCYDLEAFYLVGGFAECQLLQNSIKAEFSQKYKIILSPTPQVDIVKGAVVFGISPDIISERISQCTYGVQCNENFDSLKHSSKHRFISKDGTVKSSSVFSLMVKKNEPITSTNRKFEKTFRPTNKDDTRLSIPIYTSDNPNVTHTSECGCKLVGEISHELQNPEKGLDRSLTVILNFSGTEILVMVRDSESSKISFTTVDFLGKQC